MKVRVTKPFKDKYTKGIYQTGQEIEVTKERYEELTSAAIGSFVEAVELLTEEKKPPAKAKKTQNKTKSKK